MNTRDRLNNVIQLIEIAASTRWGECWQAELIRAYCDLESAEQDTAIAAKNRRTMLRRVFQERSCSGVTLLRLAAAAGVDVSVSQKV